MVLIANKVLTYSCLFVCRFYGRIALEANNHDQSTLEAIRSNAAGLKGISGERIWMELKKILEGNYAGELMIIMLENCIGPYIGKF